MIKTIITLFIIVISASSFLSSSQPALKAAMERGKRVYDVTCITCHQADGQGVQRMNPTIVKTKWILGPKRPLIKIVLDGLTGGQIEIDGDEFHNPMPPQAALLTDQQIADVLTYVRNSFGNKASIITASEVKAARLPLINKTITKKTVKKTAPAKPVKKTAKQ